MATATRASVEGHRRQAPWRCTGQSPLSVYLHQSAYFVSDPSLFVLVRFRLDETGDVVAVDGKKKLRLSLSSAKASQYRE